MPFDDPHSGSPLRTRLSICLPQSCLSVPLWWKHSSALSVFPDVMLWEGSMARKVLGLSLKPKIILAAGEVPRSPSHF